MEAKQAPKVQLIASDTADPKVPGGAGRRYEVTAVSIVDTNLRQVKEESAGFFRRKPKRPPRLCGSHDTCLAIVELPDEERAV